MPDIFATIKAIKLMWMKRLLKRSNKYLLIAKQNSRIIDFQHFFFHNMSKECQYIALRVIMVSKLHLDVVLT